MSEPTERERLSALKELMYQRLDAMDAALKLQATEYERRLELLNHAHQRAIDVLATYLPREKFESFEQEYTRRHVALSNLVESRAVSVGQQTEARAEKLSGELAAFRREIDERLGAIDIWRAEQRAVQSDREKATNLKVAVVGLVLAGLTLALHFWK